MNNLRKIQNLWRVGLAEIFETCVIPEELPSGEWVIASNKHRLPIAWCTTPMKYTILTKNGKLMKKFRGKISPLASKSLRKLFRAKGEIKCHS
jgi:hypothetical protein